MPRMRRLSAALPAVALLVTAVLLVTACGHSRRAQRFKRSELQATLQRLETPGLLLGEFELAPDGILDGDTVLVQGLKTSLRLLAIDTEETFKHDYERRLYDQGWDVYLRTKQAETNRPVKIATPLGMDAKDYAKHFFDGVEKVRLERDHPKEIRGRYGRYLVYIFALKDGKWVNYNIECVRDGMSPYFTKYSYSRRFHDEFVAAQAEARAKKIGIWDPTKEHYPDYDARLAWWNARADFIRDFEKEAETHENHIILTNWDSLRRLEKHLEQEVEVLGLVGTIKLGDRGPSKVMLSRRRGGDFPLIFFDNDVLGSSGIMRYRGEYVRVKGVVKTYRNSYRQTDELQIVVSLPGQITVPTNLPDFAIADAPGPEGPPDENGESTIPEDKDDDE